MSSSRRPGALADVLHMKPLLCAKWTSGSDLYCAPQAYASTVCCTLQSMVRCALVLLAACGAATASMEVSSSTAVTGSAAVTSSIDETADQTPPEDVDLHLHETPNYVADVDKLYVEITSDDEHADVLLKSATAGLSSTDYVVGVTDGGDIELHVEVASLEAAPTGTSCQLKIFVLRMPQHDLLAIASGGAQVTGRNATEKCLSATGTAIVRDKLPLLFKKRLEAKQ